MLRKWTDIDNWKQMRITSDADDDDDRRQTVTINFRNKDKAWYDDDLNEDADISWSPLFASTLSRNS